MRNPPFVVTLSFILALAACDADAKKCASGEGVDPVARWGACNASCVSKNNQESCAAAKVHAAAACAYSVKNGNPNHSACREACENGDKDSCAVK
jgi:hypothetical protein